MTWTEVRNQIADVFSGMVTSAIEAAPRVLSAIVLLLLMLIAAKVVERVLRFLLSRLKIDTLVAHVGIDQILKKMGIRQRLERFVPRLAYFLLLLLFAQAAAQAYGLTAISKVVTSFAASDASVVSPTWLHHLRGPRRRWRRCASST
ncbi:MAG: mechanosensitive ion channel family protein [Thermoanaerobaculia bacterium]